MDRHFVIIGPIDEGNPAAGFLVLVVLGLIVFITGNIVSSIKEKIPAFIELLYRYLVWVGPGLVALASLITILSRDTVADGLLCGICALLGIGACVLLAVLLRIRLRMAEESLLLFLSYWLLHLIYSGIIKAVVKHNTLFAGHSGYVGVVLIAIFVMIWFFLAVSATLLANYFMANIDSKGCFDGLFDGIEGIFMSGVLTVICLIGCLLSSLPLFKDTLD